MNKLFLSIFTLLICLLLAGPAEARLTLGVVASTGDVPGEITSDQAKALASLLAGKLEEDILVKELADSATLVNWLDQFAMLDLALLSAEQVKAHPGRFLLIGPFGAQGEFNLVCRQGIPGDLPERAARAVRESGFVPWRSPDALAPSPPDLEAALPEPAPEPPSIDKMIEARVEQQLSVPDSDRIPAPPEERPSRRSSATEKPPVKELVLGIFPGPDSLLQTPEQAEQLAAALAEATPVSIKVRQFSQRETFIEWFMRYRMVDLAVLSPEAAETYLGRDYYPLAEFLRSGRPVEEPVALVIMRRGQNEELQEPFRQSLLDLAQAVDGEALLAELQISGVALPGGIADQPLAVTPVHEPEVEVEPAPAEPVIDVIEETALETLPKAIALATPVEPVPPTDPGLRALPELPEYAKSGARMPLPETPGVLPDLPELPPAPADPASPVMVEALVVPAIKVPSLESTVLDVPPAPSLVELEVPAVPPGPEAVVEPPVPPVEVEPKLVAPASTPVPAVKVPSLEPTVLDVPLAPSLVELEVPAVPLEPEAVVEPSVPPVEVESELVAPLIAPVPVQSPETSDVVIRDAVSSLPPEEPVPVAGLPTTELETVAEPAGLPVEEEPSLAFEEEVLILEQGSPAEAAASEGLLPADEQQLIVEEITEFDEVVPASDLTERTPFIEDQAEQLSEVDLVAMLGEETVASMVAQPDLPQELRPSGIPIVRPGRVPSRSTTEDDRRLVATIPEPLKRTEPARPRPLLSDPSPEPGIVYVVPFVSVMVPKQVSDRIFDQFVDIMIREGEALDLQFLILKEGLQRVTPEWLAARKHVTGEIYGYVEDAGSTSTELRAKARLIYRTSNKNTSALNFQYPIRRFFDNNLSDLDVERIKLSDAVAETLANELLKVLKN